MKKIVLGLFLFLFCFSLSSCTAPNNDATILEIKNSYLVGIWQEQNTNLEWNKRIGYYYFSPEGKIFWFASEDFPKEDDFDDEFIIADEYKIENLNSEEHSFEITYVYKNSKESIQFTMSNQNQESMLTTITHSNTNENYVKINSNNSIYTIYNTKYDSLSKTQKLTIITWIENRYEYYDDIEESYSGDKYTKTIFDEAAKLFNKTYAEIDAVWSQSYYLKYE